MKFLYIHNILTLIITNFISWALEKHPEPETNPIFVIILSSGG